MKTILLCLTFTTATLAGSAASVPSFDGTWQWRFTMPDGTEVNPKLKLKQDGTNLTGISSLRSGTETAITNGLVRGEELQFEVVRERNGATVVTRYAGKRDGDLIHGQVESNWSGESRSYPWEAHRLAGIEGTWKWFTYFGERRFETKVTLKLAGDKLSGTMPGRDGPPTEIKNATFKDGEVSFDVERGRGDFKSFQKFEGTLDHDSITGTIETTFGTGEPRIADWDARRAD